MNPTLKRILLWYWGCAFNRFFIWLLLCLVIGFPIGWLVSKSLDIIGIEGDTSTLGTSGLLFESFQYMVMILVVGAALALMGRYVERRTIEEIGLAPRPAIPETAIGFVIGFGLISLVVGILAVAGGYRITSFESKQGLAACAAGILCMFGTAISEELIFRGVLFRIMEDVIGTVGSITLSGVLFGLMHHINPGATWTSSIYIAVEAGLLLGAAFAFTRQLWLAIGIHWGWNATMGVVWNLPVSGQELPGIIQAESPGPEWLTGGAFGPEASFLTYIVCTISGVLLLWMAYRRGLVFTPQWMQRLSHRSAESLRPGRYVDWKRLRQRPADEELVEPLPIAEPIA